MLAPEMLQGLIASALRWLIAALVGYFGAKVAEPKIGEMATYGAAFLVFVLSVAWSGREKLVWWRKPPDSAPPSGPPAAVLLLMASIIGGLIVTGGVLSPVGCAGQKAREHIGAPAVNATSSGLRADALEGIRVSPLETREACSATVQTFFEAIASLDVNRIKREAVPLWPAVKALAQSGIDAQVADGTLSAGAAESHRERVRQYETTLLMLDGGAT